MVTNNLCKFVNYIINTKQENKRVLHQDLFLISGGMPKHIYRPPSIYLKLLASLPSRISDPICGTSSQASEDILH